MATIAEKLATIADNQVKVFEAGKAQGGDKYYDTFWDIYQEKGKKVNYNFAFAGSSWNAEIFKPKYPLNGMTYANNMFAGAHGLIEIPYTIDLTNLTGVAAQVFDGSTALKKIKEVIVDEDNTFSYCFRNCNALEEIEFIGTIAQSGLDFHWSTKLTKASLKSILSALTKDEAKATGLTCTLAKNHEAVIQADNELNELMVYSAYQGWKFVFS